MRFPCATRHISVDTEGLLLCAIVHAADIQDRDGGIMLIAARGAGGLAPPRRASWRLRAAVNASAVSVAAATCCGARGRCD